jgi:MFS transporter, putative metabolite:H+ symporter
MLGPLGPTAVFIMFAAVLLVIALDVLLLGEETRGRTLEEISEAPGSQTLDVAPAGSRG